MLMSSHRRRFFAVVVLHPVSALATLATLLTLALMRPICDDAAARRLFATAAGALAQASGDCMRRVTACAV